MDSRSRRDELLVRYWACETSLEEEKELREYFSQPGLPEEMSEVAPLFRYFEDERKKHLEDSGFDAQLMKKMEPAGKGKLVILLRNSMRIAAGIAVLLVAIWLVRSEVRDAGPVEAEITDPELALEETKRALMIISKNFKKGEEQARKINLFNEAQKQIQEGVHMAPEEEKKNATEL
jgi:hypothetical protein